MNTILFDLDGTLIDSSEGIIKCVLYTLDFYGIKEPDTAKLYRFIGPPLSESFERYYGFSHEKAYEAVQKYREYYTVTGIFENALYDGIADLLADLRGAGRVLSLATSKPEPFALRILEHFGIAALFDHVAGAELTGPRNSKSSVLRHACGLCGVEDMQQCLMVGDRKYDVLGAHAVGMPCAGVLYGYGSRHELEEAGAECLCDDVPSLRRRLT